MLNRIFQYWWEYGLWSLVASVLRKLNAIRFRPDIEVLSSSDLLRLGSKGCGKVLLEAPELYGATIISCGLGEDGSFDIEFAERFGATVIIVDPTPRAISHFNLIITRLGLDSEVMYRDSGVQDIRAYGLSTIKECQLKFVDKAIWINEGDVKLFAPTNPKNVSHSITNFQRNYDTEGDYPHIIVDSITYPQLLERFGLTDLPLLKLDIEGAEIAVLPAVLEAEVFPTQILVEYDGLNRPCKRAKLEAEKIDNLLRSYGYQCMFYDGVADYVYARIA